MCLCVCGGGGGVGGGGGELKKKIRKNEKKFLRLENPPPPPHNFSNGPSLSGVRTLMITMSLSRSIQLPQYSKSDVN